MIDEKKLRLRHGDVARLEDLVDREALADVCKSFFELFGLPIRVFSTEGTLLADAHEERRVCQYVNSLSGGRIACAQVVEPGAAARAGHDRDPAVLHRRGLPRRADRVRRPPPRALRDRPVPAGRAARGARARSSSIDPAIDADARARRARGDAARARRDGRAHRRSTCTASLDLILFSGHSAYLTSEMHLASVRESYRELAEKNARLQEALRQAQGARPAQVELPRDREPRAAHAAHVDHRLLRDARDRHRGRAQRRSSASSSRPSARKGDQLLVAHHATSSTSASSSRATSRSASSRSTAARAHRRGRRDRGAARAAQEAIALQVDVRGRAAEGEGRRRAHPADAASTSPTTRSSSRRRAAQSRLGARATELEPVTRARRRARARAARRAERRRSSSRVTDSGIGIPPQHKERVFDAFYPGRRKLDA